MKHNIFPVAVDYSRQKRDEKNCGKNPLSGTEHFSYFRAKLNFSRAFLIKEK